jgi:antitoxin HicB
MKKNVKDYLKLPYTREILPDFELGGFTALIREFPGCVTQGETVAEAYEYLEDAAFSWIEAALALGQDIPQPCSDGEFSGKFALRLPRSLHRKASMAAKHDGVSLNQFILTAVAENVGESKARISNSREIRIVFDIAKSVRSTSETPEFFISSVSPMGTKPEVN